MEQTRISEVLKRNKSYKRPLLEQELYDNIIGREIEPEILGTRILNETNFRDYQDDKLKRRAQTISVAYNIAVKLLLSLEMTGTTETYWKNSEYMKDPGKLEELKTDAFDNFVYDTMINAVEQVDLLDRAYKQVNPHTTELDSFLVNLSGLSVSLAWMEVYYKTGFMPREYQIVHPHHEVHVGLTREVMTILTNTFKIFKEQLPFLKKQNKLKLEFDKQVSKIDEVFAGTANILINDTMLLEIKTSGKAPTEETIKKDFHHAIGLSELNKDIRELYIYYARYDFIARVEV